MDEPVRAVEPLDELLTDSLLQSRVDLDLRSLKDQRKRRDSGDVSKAGEILQGALVFLGRRVSFTAMRSATLSVYPLAWMRFGSQDHRPSP